MYTLCIIKPDATERGLEWDIINDLLNDGFCISQVWKGRLGYGVAESLYQEHSDKNHFPELVEYMCSGWVVALKLYKLGEQSVWPLREFIGVSDPAICPPWTLRAKYGQSQRRNSVHSSDSPEAAKRELALFGW